MFDVAKVIETCNLAHVQPGAIKDVNFLDHFWATLKDARREEEAEKERRTRRHRAAQLHTGVAQLVGHLRRLLLLLHLLQPDELLGGGV